jgi:hypothetical protein
MGNANRLLVFENIINEYDNNDTNQLQKAVQEKNIPYIFIAITVFGVNLDSHFGIMKLLYQDLLNENKHQFTAQELEVIQSQEVYKNRHINNMCIKKKYMKIYNDILLKKQNNILYSITPIEQNYTPLAHAIVNGDANTVITMLILMDSHKLNHECGINKNYKIKDLLQLHQYEPIWQIVYQFMNKGYNYTRLKKFIIETLAIKTFLFEIYKCILLINPYFRITSWTMNHYVNLCDPLNIHDVFILTQFNNILKSCNKDSTPLK